MKGNGKGRRKGIRLRGDSLNKGKEVGNGMTLQEN